MKRLLVLFALLSSAAFAGERDIINPDVNGDIKVKVNAGGTPTDALTITGSTSGLILGANAALPGTATTHILNGSLFSGGTTTTDGGRQFFIGANAYNTATVSNRDVTNGLGGVIMKFVPRTSDTATAFEIGANKASDSATTVYTPTLQMAQNGTFTFATGIKLPSAGGTASTLTAYEENVWTPIIVFSGGNGTLAYNSRAAIFTRIGRIVVSSLYMQISKGTASGNLTSISLPYTANSATGAHQACSVQSDQGFTVPASRSQVQAYIPYNTATVLPVFASTTGGNATYVTAADLATTFAIMIQCTYQL